MNEEQLEEYLKTKLSIRINTKWEFSSKTVEVSLLLDCKEISTDYLHLNDDNTISL